MRHLALRCYLTLRYPTLSYTALLCTVLPNPRSGFLWTETVKTPSRIVIIFASGLEDQKSLDPRIQTRP